MTIKTIPDLFRRCRGRETGHWHVGGELSRTLHLDSGDIVFASSNFPVDKLSAIMVNCGKLTQEQMDFAMANLKPGMTIGKNLIEMGFITQRDLLEAARLQVEQIARSAMLASDSPVFDIRDELEQSIVRLPLSTPSLLFAGVMAVSDREGLLELLGPLNQVVLLQGKRVYDELDLPADLLKMARMMDGTHTILELSNEASIEPMRVSAFALFLREMGWGKLFELPPIDRKAITKALDTPEPTKPPSNIPSPRKQLMAVIEDAAKETVKLNDPNLEAMLDSIGSIDDPGEIPEEGLMPLLEPPALEYGEGEPKPGEPEVRPSGQDAPKSVGRVLPFSGAPVEPLQEPSITIGLDGSFGEEKDDDAGEDEYLSPPKMGADDGKRGGSATPKKLGKALTLLLVLAILATLTVYLQKTLANSKKPTATSAPWFEKPLEPNLPTSTEPGGMKTEITSGNDSLSGTAVQESPPNVQPPSVAPTQVRELTSVATDSSPVNISREARFRAIAEGNAAQALRQGIAYRATIPSTNWTIQLITACQGETLQRSAQIIGSARRDRPEFFLTPVRMRDGRDCYRLFVGSYTNKNVADAEVLNLLNIFQDPGVQPRAILVGEITEAQ